MRMCLDLRRGMCVWQMRMREGTLNSIEEHFFVLGFYYSDQ